MRVLVVGSGAREHALAWRIAASPSVDKVFASPGNPGIAEVAECILPPERGNAGFARIADEIAADLTVVGPEQPLVDGLADLLSSRGFGVFGPSAAAARIEGSKAWAKEVLTAAGAPTGRASVFTDPDEAARALERFDPPWVVKADGLAAGKGVSVCTTREEAEAVIRACLTERRFGEAGAQILLEEHLGGSELSVFFLCDGTRALAVGSAQDFKRVGDADTGPNTGGMGSYSPVPLAGPGVEERVRREIVEPVLAEMARRGAPYRGVLYVGLMQTAQGPKVFEFNCRFGDPETQVLMPRIDGDLARTLRACAEGDLAAADVRLSDDAVVGVVAASGGYPGSFTAGLPVRGVGDAAARPGVEVFHAGTAVEDGRLVTSGGRVLTVAARGPSVAEARARVYDAIARISFEGMHYRRDIAS